MNVTYEIVGQLTGPIWQPGFDDCRKDVHVGFTRTSDPIHTQSQACDLREMVERITDDGDFRAARLTGDSFLRVTQTHSSTGWRHMHEHVYDLTRFPSIADYIAADRLYVDPYGEDE